MVLKEKTNEILEKLRKIANKCEKTISTAMMPIRKKFFPLSLGLLSDNTISRYLVGELLLYFIVSFLFFFMVFFVNQILLLAENILQKRVPLWDVLRLITYCLPFIIAQSAPFSTLVGFLMCIGRMMSSNEILIMRASGFGYKVILKPVIILGMIISLASFFVNDYLLPLGTIHYTQLYRSILMSNPAVEIEPHSIKRTNDSTLIIGDVKGSDISDLIIFDKDSEGNQRLIIGQQSSVLKSQVQGIVMQMNMNDATAIFFKKSEKHSFDILTSKKLTMNVFESSFFDQSNRGNPREMTTYDLHHTIKEMQHDEKTPKLMLNQYKLEYNKKFSTPFGSLFFALLAMPLAILFGKHNGQTIGLIIGLFVSVFYWAMMILGQIVSSKSGTGGIISMWLPNMLVAFSGLGFYAILVHK